MDAVQVKHKSEGVKPCCYGTCNSDTRYRHHDDMKDVFFIPFPKPITQREKCERWIKECGRLQEDFTKSNVALTCAVNTLSVVKDQLTFILTRCLHCYTMKNSFAGSKGNEKHRHQEANLLRFKKKNISTTAAECLLQLSNQLVPEHESSSSVSLDPESMVACTENMTLGCEKGIQTDSLPTEHKEVQTIYEKNFINAKIENMLLNNEIKLTRCDDKCDSAKSTPLSLHSIKDDDVKMKLFTGLYCDKFLALIE